MEAKELMLGDWCFCELNGKPEKVQAIYEDKVMLDYNDLYPYDEIQPIPITPEILEKNGFKLKDEGETYSEYVSVWDKISIISFAFYKETICGVDTLLDCELGFAGGLDRIHHCHIKYVHQLQNALWMCGIEKDIMV